MIYITADTHREWDIHKINPNEFIAGNSLTRNDYLIICGDFGCIWDDGNGDRFWLNWLESLPWNTLFVDGNHENFDALNKYPVVDWNGGKVHQISSNIFHLMRGEIYTIDGKKYLAFGGGYSHDYTMRKEHETWWKDEMPTAKDVSNLWHNLKKNGHKVDYILSHDIYTSHSKANTYDIDMNHYGKQYINVQTVLEKIANKVEYACWFNGHYHADCVEYRNEKPCVTLFDKVLNLNDLEKEINAVQK